MKVFNIGVGICASLAIGLVVSKCFPVINAQGIFCAAVLGGWMGLVSGTVFLKHD